jgi:hypothetical protein
MQSAWEAIVAQISAQGKAQRAGEVGPFPARMDTIQRRGKQRVRRSRTALVVEFEDVEGRSWSGVFLALQKDRDWRVEGWSGGRSDFGLKRPNVKEPRANLGGRRSLPWGSGLWSRGVGAGDRSSRSNSAGRRR